MYNSYKYNAKCYVTVISYSKFKFCFQNSRDFYPQNIFDAKLVELSGPTHNGTWKKKFAGYQIKQICRTIFKKEAIFIDKCGSWIFLSSNKNKYW